MQASTTPQSNFRRRAPFVHDEDGEGENRVMDEQEQEAVINDLRERSSAANKQFLVAVQAFVLLSMYIHIIFFFMSFTSNPFDILLPSTSTAPRTPLSRLLDLISFFIQFNILLYLPPTRESTVTIARWACSIRGLPLPQTVLLSITFVLPLVALLAGYEWKIIAWHAVSVTLAGTVQLVLHWIKEGEEGIAQLEALRYDAKGA